MRIGVVRIDRNRPAIFADRPPRPARLACSTLPRLKCTRSSTWLEARGRLQLPARHRPADSAAETRSPDCCAPRHRRARGGAPRRVEPRRRGPGQLGDTWPRESCAPMRLPGRFWTCCSALAMSARIARTALSLREETGVLRVARQPQATARPSRPTTAVPNESGEPDGSGSWGWVRIVVGEAHRQRRAFGEEERRRVTVGVLPVEVPRS